MQWWPSTLKSFVEFDFNTIRHQIASLRERKGLGWDKVRSWTTQELEGADGLIDKLFKYTMEVVPVTTPEEDDWKSEMAVKLKELNEIIDVRKTDAEALADAEAAAAAKAAAKAEEEKAAAEAAKAEEASVCKAAIARAGRNAEATKAFILTVKTAGSYRFSLQFTSCKSLMDTTVGELKETVHSMLEDLQGIHPDQKEVLPKAEEMKFVFISEILSKEENSSTLREKKIGEVSSELFLVHPVILPNLKKEQYNGVKKEVEGIKITCIHK